MPLFWVSGSDYIREGNMLISLTPSYYVVTFLFPCFPDCVLTWVCGHWLNSLPVWFSESSWLFVRADLFSCFIKAWERTDMDFSQLVVNVSTVDIRCVYSCFGYISDNIPDSSSCWMVLVSTFWVLPRHLYLAFSFGSGPVLWFIVWRSFGPVHSSQYFDR